MEERVRDTYEKPTIDIVEFTIEDSIATSGLSSFALTCYEEIGGSL